MLGTTIGGAVRLSHAKGPLVVAEGIETALSLSCGLISVPASIWAALSCAGMVKLQLPKRSGRLIIASDGDEPGRQAAYKLAERAVCLGWSVDMFPAPAGLDWNEVLQMKEKK